VHLKQIEAFVAVVKYHSFSRAAEAIYLSQPTISSHIQSLENYLGTQLLVRTNKGIYPSEAGKIFYTYAQEIVNLCDKAQQKIKSCSNDVQGALIISASTVPSLYIVPEVLSRLSQKYPKLSFGVNQHSSIEVVQEIMGMTAEIGIAGAKIEKAGCAFEPFLTDRLVIITPNNSQFRALQGQITPEIMADSPFISREHGSGTRKEYEQFLETIGIDKKIHIIARMQSTESVKQAVKNGLGISIISHIAAEDYIKTGDILAFDYNSPWLNRKFYFVYHKKRALSPAAEVFMEETRNIYA